MTFSFHFLFFHKSYDCFYNTLPKSILYIIFYYSTIVIKSQYHRLVIKHDFFGYTKIKIKLIGIMYETVR